MNTYKAKNLNEALEMAAKDKNSTIEELNYSIIEEKKGILGLGNSVVIEAYTLEDVKEFIFNYLGDFFTNINMDIEVIISPNSNGFNILLNNDEENARLIGKNGRTLHALNTILRGAVNNQFKNKYDIELDINNYQKNRNKKLINESIKIAKNVRRTKIDASLDPMSNIERKIIHEALAKFKYVRTESEGEGRNRHIVIKYVNENEVEK